MAQHVKSNLLAEFLEKLRRLASQGAQGGVAERRCSQRFEYISAAQSVWLRKDGHPANGENELTLIIKDVSEGGVGFFHVEPMVVGDRLGMTLVRPDQATMDVQVEVRHCRRIGQQTYLIGARFVG